MSLEAFIRGTIRLIGSFGLSGFVLVVKFSVVAANYMACLLSFQLLNYETWPLPEDKLLGWLFVAFAPEADLCHLYALGLVLTQAMGLVFWFHFAFRILGLWRDRRWYLENNEPQSARQAMSQFWLDLFFLVILSVPLAYVIYWDIYLFRYRGVVQSFYPDNPEGIGNLIPNWEILKEERGHFFALFLTRVGAEGYIGATALVCLLFEITLGKIRDNWTRWWALFQADNQVPGQPAYANGYVGGAQEEIADQAGAGHPAPAGLVSPPPGQSGQEVAPQAAPGRPGREVPTPEPAVADRRPVIGGQPGEMVSLAAALQQRQRYHVDPVTHEIWDRRAYEAIFGQQEAA